jgi:predicted ABC-type ATPase
VPEEKIISRYERSLDLLLNAIRNTNRAYIFDNSGHQQIWIAEITEGSNLEIRSNRMPSWFQSAVMNKIRK